MLNHVNGQKFMIQIRQRGRHRNPDQKQSKEKTGGAPGRNGF
jgi:hypothetical protein